MNTIRLAQAFAKECATSVVNEILDRGLANSTWREMHPDAYRELLKYRADFEKSCADVLLLGEPPKTSDLPPERMLPVAPQRTF